MNLGVNWRHIFFLSIGLRFLFGLSNSYIHPDEHFQSLEILSNKIFNYSTTYSWEFTSENPIRSYGPLYMIYGPLLLLVKSLGLDPLKIWYLVRLQLVILNWVVTDLCLYHLLPTKPERVKATFFTLTSYITLVYQSHCFSNSIETPLVLLVVLLINDLRFDTETGKSTCDYKRLFFMGALISVGIFNRITFPAFIIFPFYFVMKYLLKFKMGVILLGFGFLIPTILFIVLDTYEYKGVFDVWSIDTWVITPLNNILYNSNYDNLSLHGIHPRYTHLLVNLPQILGPAIILLINKSNPYLRTTPFVSVSSGLIFLSIIPHQELRFLLPLVPLVFCCLNFGEAEQKESSTSKFLKITPIIIKLWYLFNIIMAVIMGIFHQGGVAGALDHMHSSLPDSYVQVWWRTYTPPTWLLGTEDLEMVSINHSVEVNSPKLIIDTMGSDQENVNSLIEELQNNGKPIYLVAPIASMNCEFDSSMNLELQWKYLYHVDLDHLNFSSKECLTPGLGIYKVLI